MSARDDLFRTIEQSSERLERASAADVILRQVGVPEPTVEDVAKVMRWADGYTSVAIDAILAAGWRPPARTVSTVEELDALPEGTVLLDTHGRAWQLILCTHVHEGVTYREWRTGGIDDDQDDEGLGRVFAPLTVLREGGAG